MFIKSKIVKKLKETGLRWGFVAEYLKIDPRRKLFYEPQKKLRQDYIGLNLYKKINNILKERNSRVIVDKERYLKDNLYMLATKNYLEGGDIRYRLASIYLFAGGATFDKIWEIEKENETSELQLTADEIYLLIKNYKGGIFEKLAFAQEVIDYREEIKFIYKRGVKKHTIGLLYQLHEYGRIQSNSGTLFHFEKYFKKLPKINNGKKYKFNDEIQNKLVEFVEGNKIPATIENATNMIKYLNNNINPNEAVKVLISVNIKHPEYLKEPIEVIENEYGRMDFDKRDYFSIYEEKLLVRRTR